ncbi:MAG: methionyl-tRNA formyltransferase [Patescibacteria group bacterium]|jgi:methionyl-tRNA formyltransferase
MARGLIKTVFAGTPDFAAPFLKALFQADNFEVAAVITQPDKPAGRRRELKKPPVKILAEELGLPVYQPEKISGASHLIRGIDLLVVAAYGQIIPKELLLLPKYGCVNVHASLLPKYRGASPIQAAILNGDSETGITIMKMGAGLDTGPILGQNIVSIEAAETTGTLFSKLVSAGLDVFVPILEKYVRGEIMPEAQDDRRASYVRTLKKSDGQIDWKKSAVDIERMVRAYSPWPGAFTKADGKKFKISAAEIGILEPKNLMIPGEIFLINGRLGVKCGQGALVISKIQPEGKKEMAAEEFVNGHRWVTGKKFE